MATKDKINFLTLPEPERSVCSNKNDITVVTHFELYRAQGGVPTTRMLDKWLLAMQRLQADRVANDYSNRAPYQTHNPNALNIGPNATSSVGGSVNINSLPTPTSAAIAASTSIQANAAPVANAPVDTTTTTKYFLYEVGPTVKACVTVVMDSSVAFATRYFDHKNQEAATNARWWDKVTEKFSMGATYLGKIWAFGS